MQSFFSNKLQPHLSHQIGLIHYKDNKSDDIGIFCNTCNCVILSEHDFEKDWSEYYYNKLLDSINKLLQGENNEDN